MKNLIALRRPEGRLVAAVLSALALVHCAPAGTRTTQLAVSATSSASWQNFAMPDMTGAFTLDFDAVPGGPNLGALTTLSSGPASSSNNGAVVLRFNTSGAIDASNGSAFAAVESLTYNPGTTYHFKVSVDISTHQYSAVVTPAGGANHVIAQGYSFVGSAVTGLDDIGIQSGAGSHTLSNAWLTVPISTGSAVPAAASNLRATSSSATSVLLQWADNSNNESGFFIQRRATHGDPTFVTVAQVGADVTQFNDTGLNTWWQYDYLIVAFNSVGNAPASNTVTLQVTPPQSPPDAGTPADGGVPPGAIDVKAHGARGDGTTDDFSAIQAVVNSAPSGSTVFFPSGTYKMSSTLIIPSNLTLMGQGTATLNYGGNWYAIQGAGDNDTVTGLTLNGGGIDLSLNSGQVGQSGWTITYNHIQNIVSGNDGVHVENILGKGAASVISHNTFTNIWGLNGQGYPAWVSSCTVDACAYGSGIFFHFGLDNTTIDSNTFDEIGFNAIKGFWDGFMGKTNPYTGHNVVISNNVMTRVRRIGLEVQAAGQGHCPGGCDYTVNPTDGTVIKGNYYHNPVFQQDNFGLSLMVGGTNPVIANNTSITENPTCIWPVGISLENSMNGGVLQGNVMASVYQSCAGNYNLNHGWAGYIVPGYTHSGLTNYFQNNVACGDHAAQTGITHDPGDSATDVERGDYWSDTCPAGNNIATSSVSIAFTSPDHQSFPSGGNGTWNAAVVSNLSIRNVQFFVDGSSSAAVTQELQDVSTTFANDRRWLYHATLNTSGLSSGSHTLTAVATDVSGSSQAAAQTFTR